MQGNKEELDKLNEQKNNLEQIEKNLKKSEINYFIYFFTLWSAVNSWYKFFYSDKNYEKDRDYINEIKKDDKKSNSFYQEFESLILASHKEAIEFKKNLELLYYALEYVELKDKEDKLLRFNTGNLLDDNAIIIKNIKTKKDGQPYKKDQKKVIQLEKIYITSDLKKVWEELFEKIYQVRNLVVHGSLEHNQHNYKVVKYCYFILFDLMEKIINNRKKLIAKK